MEFSAKTRLPLHSIVLFILRRHSASLFNFGIIFTHIHLYHWGESKRALKTPFWKLMPKGREYLPKAKGMHRTTTPISKSFETSLSF
jgi:hypothetical protein